MPNYFTWLKLFSEITKFFKKVVPFIMDKNEKMNDFELAIFLLQQQFENDPYSTTKEQVDVLSRHDKIQKEKPIKRQKSLIS